MFFVHSIVNLKFLIATLAKMHVESKINCYLAAFKTLEFPLTEDF